MPVRQEQKELPPDSAPVVLTVASLYVVHGSVVCACRSLQAKQTIAAVNLVLILIDVLLGKQIEKFAGQILE
jgi:hypothetical protein